MRVYKRRYSSTHFLASAVGRDQWHIMLLLSVQGYVTVISGMLCYCYQCRVMLLSSVACFVTVSSNILWYCYQCHVMLLLSVACYVTVISNILWYCYQWHVMLLLSVPYYVTVISRVVTVIRAVLCYCYQFRIMLLLSVPCYFTVISAMLCYCYQCLHNSCCETWSLLQFIKTLHHPIFDTFAAISLQSVQDIQYFRSTGFCNSDGSRIKGRWSLRDWKGRPQWSAVPRDLQTLSDTISINQCTILYIMNVTVNLLLHVSTQLSSSRNLHQFC